MPFILGRKHSVNHSAFTQIFGPLYHKTVPPPFHKKRCFTEVTQILFFFELIYFMHGRDIGIFCAFKENMVRDNESQARLQESL